MTITLSDGIAVYGAVVATGAAIIAWRVAARVPKPSVDIYEAIADALDNDSVRLSCVARNRSPYPVVINAATLMWRADPSLDTALRALPRSISQVWAVESVDTTGHRATSVMATRGEEGQAQVLREVEVESASRSPSSPSPASRLRYLSLIFEEDLHPDVPEHAFPVTIAPGQGVMLWIPLERDVLRRKGSVELNVETNDGRHFTKRVASPIIVWNGRRGRTKSVPFEAAMALRRPRGPALGGRNPTVAFHAAEHARAVEDGAL